MSEAPVRPGDILAGKYRVERILGAGNMGVVVAAMHVELGQRVALKFLQPGKTETREQRERFLREARAAGRLKSQHVARVLDLGTLENEAPYIVMEFLEGQDLAALLKARGPLPFEEAAMFMLQACEAVGEAHAAGIVHRDLKPANLFCAEDVGGSVCIKVVDFGISKLSGVDLTLTNEAEVFGSPLYMSPEQMRSSKSVDGRSDLWSLGVVLYQLVAGRTPFHSETITELCSRVLMGESTPLSTYRSDAPPGFETVVLRCLERDREQRFADVAAFAAALAPYAPEHARVYAGRVSRAMGRKGAPAASVPELPTPPRVIEPAPAGNGAMQAGEAIAHPLGRAAVPSSPASAELPAARAALSSSLRSAAALSVSASQASSQAAVAVSAIEQGRGLSRRAVTRAMAVLGMGLGIAGATGIWIAQRRSSAPTSASASAAASVPASASVLVSASASVPEGPPTGMEASQQTPAGGPEVRAVPSASAKAGAKPSLPRAPSTTTARPVATATPTAPPAKPAVAPSSPKKRDGIL